MEKTKNPYSFSEKIYFMFFCVVIFRHFLANTMIDYKWINGVFLVISFLLGICVVAKILAEWKCDWGIKDIIIAIVTVGFIAASNFYIAHESVWEYLLLILGARNVGYKKIMKNYVILSSALLLITVAASLLGIIDNLIFYRNESSDTVRYAMGFVYVTYFCAHLFFICAAYAFLRGKAIRYIEIAGIAAIGFVCYKLSEGRNSTICIGMLVVALLISKIFAKKESNGKHKILNILIPSFMTIAAVFSIVLAKVYNEGSQLMTTINTVMGHRPEMDQEAFNRFDVTLLGQNFNQTMFGGTSSVGFPDNYFVIDCSYVSILLSMGILALVAILVMWFVITRNECKKGMYIKAIILCIIALHAFIEKDLFNISYNPFFLLLFANISDDESGIVAAIKDEADSKKRVIKNCLSLIIFAALVEVLAFNLQSLTSSFKSYISVSEYDTRIRAKLNDNNNFDTSDGMNIVVYEVDDKVKSLFMSLNIYDKETQKLQKNLDYYYVLYGVNDTTQEMEPIETVHVNTSNPDSGYISFKESYDYKNYIIGFKFDGEYAFGIDKIAFNGPKPFAINYLRMLIIYIVITAVYYFGIERRDAEVTPETIEFEKEKAKETNQFESTGALRTEAHKNMQAVYDKKSSFYKVVKRAFDITASGIAIILLSPIFIITAIAIKLEDKGPVFFVQMRAGKNLKPFKMWKFRSMYVNADAKIKEMMANSNEQTGHAFKMKNDPRITKVGKFIRKFSIDELPQLFNVFFGDMSIVGPRPILVFQMEECDDYDKQRLVVQPGLTCIWQVSGRANIKWDKWIELDLDYIDTMSIGTDIKLILKTIPVVVTGDGAF